MLPVAVSVSAAVAENWLKAAAARGPREARRRLRIRLSVTHLFAAMLAATKFTEFFHPYDVTLRITFVLSDSVVDETPGA